MSVPRRGVRYDDILVHDIMTLREQLEVLRYEDALQARVGAIVATLKAAGRQHALVTDTDVQGMRKSVRVFFRRRNWGASWEYPFMEAMASFAALREALAS